MENGINDEPKKEDIRDIVLAVAREIRHSAVSDLLSSEFQTTTMATKVGGGLNATRCPFGIFGALTITPFHEGEGNIYLELGRQERPHQG